MPGRVSSRASLKPSWWFPLSVSVPREILWRAGPATSDCSIDFRRAPFAGAGVGLRVRVGSVPVAIPVYRPARPTPFSSAFSRHDSFSSPFDSWRPVSCWSALITPSSLRQHRGWPGFVSPMALARVASWSVRYRMGRYYRLRQVGRSDQVRVEVRSARPRWARWLGSGVYSVGTKSTFDSDASSRWIDRHRPGWALCPERSFAPSRLGLCTLSPACANDVNSASSLRSGR